ncbi:oxidoreductase, short chain dehydrogenase/reductase family [Synechococcus sp. PCC 7335]|uniref:SDR family oxidoreductase n=1 Tax=Synechococcus sp. (strain ATCC 29403 / PCC 7335) TaxID=91464 RepID=UPI00017ED8BB|nr:SDR family oxidoreductase [Synechococcus sp. PCC 7335]EDX85241.1 oxidoreductase, short chain dehydrogenase/reductase family [Synechococcus sp. PCC 7335]
MTTYLVTGANRGIGYEYCKQLAARGEEVIAVCRQPSSALSDLDVEIVRNIDVADQQAIETLKKALGNRPIDVLINNAGIYRQSNLDSLNIDGIKEQFEVNAIAPLVLTQALLPNLTASVDSKGGAKVAIMTSRMGSIEDNTSGGTYGYRMSKTAVSMAGKSLSHDLKSKGIAVAILHPGLVSTDMTNFNSNGISPEESVKGLLKIIDSLTLEKTGTFWHSNGQVLPW